MLCHFKIIQWLLWIRNKQLKKVCLIVKFLFLNCRFFSTSKYSLKDEQLQKAYSFFLKTQLVDNFCRCILVTIFPHNYCILKLVVTLLNGGPGLLITLLSLSSTFHSPSEGRRPLNQVKRPPCGADLIIFTATALQRLPQALIIKWNELRMKSLGNCQYGSLSS